MKQRKITSHHRTAVSAAKHATPEDSREKMAQIKDHFEEIAGDYDWYKKRAWYYYSWLKQVCRKHIPKAHTQRILELGCGTGDIIAALNPKRGLGVDISENMIKIARNKHRSKKNISFVVGTGEELKAKGTWDVILMPDVIEHLADVQATFKSFARISNPHTRIIITMINPLWESIFIIGEKLGKKMPEGPHNRITFRQMKRLLKNAGLNVTKKKFYVFIPIYIPYVSNPFNHLFNALPGIRKVGLIEVVEIMKM